MKTRFTLVFIFVVIVQLCSAIGIAETRSCSQLSSQTGRVSKVRSQLSDLLQWTTPMKLGSFLDTALPPGTYSAGGETLRVSKLDNSHGTIWIVSITSENEGVLESEHRFALHIPMHDKASINENLQLKFLMRGFDIGSRELTSRVQTMPELDFRRHFITIKVNNFDPDFRRSMRIAKVSEITLGFDANFDRIVTILISASDGSGELLGKAQANPGTAFIDLKPTAYMKELKPY